MAPSVGAMAAKCSSFNVNVHVQCSSHRGSRVELSSTAAPPCSSFCGTGPLPSRSVQWKARELWSTKQSSPITPLQRLSVFPVRAAAVTAEQPAAAAPSKQKIRIKLRSYWVHLIQQACQQILDAAKNTNAQSMGPVPLPTKRRVYCVLRSPHVDKDSREHFEIRTHYRLIDLANPNAQTIDALMQLDLPAGVDVEVKL